MKLNKKITELRVFQLLDFMIKNSIEIDKDYLLTEMSIRKEFTKEVIDFMVKDKMMSRVAAYEYARTLKTLLGNINKASKDWWRYRTNTMLEYAYQRAVASDNIDAMVKAASQLIKNNNLDKEDRQSYEWEQIKPQTFVPTDDPTIIGIKPLENYRSLKEKLLQKYSSSITDVSFEDVDIEELNEFEQ